MGPGLTQFYNDGYSRLIGDKHPAALGGDIRVTMAEAWDTLGPVIREVMETGVASWLPALLLLLERSGYREESYFDVSHAPAEGDSGELVGMLAVYTEVTQPEPRGAHARGQPHPLRGQAGEPAVGAGGAPAGRVAAVRGAAGADAGRGGPGGAGGGRGGAAARRGPGRGLTAHPAPGGAADGPLRPAADGPGGDEPSPW